MNCKVKQCCAALAARKLAERDPAIVEITRGGKNKSHHVLRKSDMKKVGLIAGGAFVVLTALNVYSHYKLHQAIADRKVKKQLEPMRAELEELRTQNEALRQALAEIKPRQPDPAPETKTAAEKQRNNIEAAPVKCRGRFCSMRKSSLQGPMPTSAPAICNRVQVYYFFNLKLRPSYCCPSTSRVPTLRLHSTKPSFSAQRIIRTLPDQVCV